MPLKSRAGFFIPGNMTMRLQHLCRFTLLGLLFAAGPVLAAAKPADPGPIRQFHFEGMPRPLADTLPKSNTGSTETPEQKEVLPIKEVPKSKKQVKPVAIPVTGIKPVQVIKPKIIKPIIKLN